MEPLWTPLPERVAATRMDAFRRSVADEHPEVVDSVALHDWSVRNPGEFWQRMWTAADVVGDPGPVAFEEGDGSVRGARFFPQSSVSYAENALAERAGAGDDAIVAFTEAGDRRSVT